MTLSVRMSPEEEALIKEFAETYDISVSSLIRTSVLEKIENEIDVKLYDNSMAEHLNEDESVSFEEMASQLGLTP
ncbi:type II toxin-antitoxin system RelB family antitoxin [Lacicoccus qingdaonensis]|uniref:Ribbon-helix-helix protein, copG family n=1 Tax=Lacicoccus qingdaonensis TaxID=576118 RepID=A0A1G9FPD5_9BACL|nr:DUF6290 family protein [Salinicoccus qingdaonensis]SDK90229.1 hypothetical protein SAMN05216216_11338 [Salinicoccus qingdaonensis]